MTILEEEISIKYYSDTNYIVLRIEVHEPSEKQQELLYQLLSDYLELEK